MVLGNVQGGEVIEVALDLRPFFHLVTQAREDIDDLVHRADQGVAVPHRREAGRHGHVQGLAGDALGHGRALHRFEAIAEQGLHLLFQDVRPLSHQRTFVAGQLAHRAEHPGEATFLAQQTNAQVFEGSGISGGSDLLGGLGLQLIQLIGELLQADGGAQGSASTTADFR